MHQNKEDDLLSNDDKPTYLDILMDKLTQSEEVVLGKFKQRVDFSKKVLDRLKKVISRREDRIFLSFVDEPIKVFESQWKYETQLYPNHKKYVKSLVNARTKNVYKDLREEKIKIEERQQVLPKYSYESDLKNQQLQTLKVHSEQIKKKLEQINSTLNNMQDQTNETPTNKNMFADLYTEQKRKQYEQYMKKKKEEKEERRKKIEEQRQRLIEQQSKKQQQIRKKEQQQAKQKKQEYLKKQMQLHQKRTEEKKDRELRNSEYLRIKKQLKQKPPLFVKIINNYENRHQYEQMQKRHLIRNQKKQHYKNIDQMKIQEHEKAYEQILRKKEEERAQKIEQLLKNNDIKTHRYSVEIPKQSDKEQEEKQMAKQRYKKIKEYQDIVKQNFMPKINEEKRKEMITLIEQLELNSKKLKKTKLDNGRVVYEELKQSNPREVGMRYLEKTKEMAAKARMFRSSSANDTHQNTPEKKKPIDYLAEWRKNPQSSSKKNKLAAVLSDRSKLSFQQKMGRVLNESQKLGEINKKNQMRLKFGKFKNSDEILSCTEQIDNNYLEIAKMKLKLIKESNTTQQSS